MGYETFDTIYEAEDFANSKENWDYYNISKIERICFVEEWQCWAVYFS